MRAEGPRDGRRVGLFNVSVCTVYDECRCVYWERVGVYVE